MNTIWIIGKKLIWNILLFTTAGIMGCAGNGIPMHKGNICSIFNEMPEWYDASINAHKKWNVPISVMMAIMYKESGFRPDAKPPRTTCLFIFPGPRPSSAYGYPQAIDSTWNYYQQQTGKWGADRDDFDDAIDFIGWYCHLSHIVCRIEKHDAYNLYLAYHEGQNGFNRGTYHRKKWLIRVAGSVREQETIYRQQLASCEQNLAEMDNKKCCLWPF